MITEKQIKLIQQMNEFCREKFDLENNHSRKSATEYISRNINEFKLEMSVANNYLVEHGEF